MSIINKTSNGSQCIPNSNLYKNKKNENEFQNFVWVLRFLLFHPPDFMCVV